MKERILQRKRIYANDRIIITRKLAANIWAPTVCQHYTRYLIINNHARWLSLIPLYQWENPALELNLSRDRLKQKVAELGEKPWCLASGHAVFPFIPYCHQVKEKTERAKVQPLTNYVWTGGRRGIVSNISPIFTEKLSDQLTFPQSHVNNLHSD